MKKLLLFAPFMALALEMDISYSPSYFKWKEPVMENKGWLHRVDFSLKQPFNKLVYGKLGASLFGGNVDYKGQTWGGTPVDSDTTYEGWEIKGLLGVDYPMSKQMKVGGYTGLAFRKWTRTSGGSLNAIGYT
ncbi:hypothetical protein [Thermocrinis minervae]|uniref:hypothetical protein n=1 Tax=Thermocrinis minervae TaxID=381751 RepID=UPI0009A60ABF|nr:hypothetical protein [Thermocrinis minervae]